MSRLLSGLTAPRADLLGRLFAVTEEQRKGVAVKAHLGLQFVERLLNFALDFTGELADGCR